MVVWWQTFFSAGPDGWRKNFSSRRAVRVLVVVSERRFPDILLCLCVKQCHCVDRMCDVCRRMAAGRCHVQSDAVLAGYRGQRLRQHSHRHRIWQVPAIYYCDILYF